jgi:GDPmannose 4,6-dehydratase
VLEPTPLEVTHMKTALITGASGQDGWYLSKFLLEKGYKVVAVVRYRHAPVYPGVEVATLNYEDTQGLDLILPAFKPDEIYNLAGQTSVVRSVQFPAKTFEINATFVALLLDRVKKHVPHARLFQAGSSEMFGATGEVPQDEQTPMFPNNMYGISKHAAFNACSYYRNSEGVYTVNGILYGHESIRRGQFTLTRKVLDCINAIKLGSKERFKFGNLDMHRDFGYAPEYVRGMWLSLQHEIPQNYVFATGTTVSIRDYIAEAFEAADLNWHDHIDSDKPLVRRYEIERVVHQGEPRRALNDLGWEAMTMHPRLPRLLVRQMLDGEEA